MQLGLGLGFFLGLDFALPLLYTLSPVWVFLIISLLWRGPLRRLCARARARALLVDEGPPLAKFSPKPLDVPGSKINLGRHGFQML